MPQRTVFICTNAAANLAWTPEEDVVLTGALVRADTRFGSDSVDVAISVDPSVLVNPMWQTPGVYFGNIVVISGETGYFPLDHPVTKGESVYFNCDGEAQVNLFYRSAE